MTDSIVGSLVSPGKVLSWTFLLQTLVQSDDEFSLVESATHKRLESVMNQPVYPRSPFDTSGRIDDALRSTILQGSVGHCEDFGLIMTEYKP